MGDLIGRSLPCGETAARAIDFPGVYCIRPSGVSLFYARILELTQQRLAMIGMSYGLGIKRRTAAYTSTSWNPNGKMGTAQSRPLWTARVHLQESDRTHLFEANCGRMRYSGLTRSDSTILDQCPQRRSTRSRAWRSLSRRVGRQTWQI